MSLVMMTQWAIFSLPSSFFPAAARSISLSDSQIGIVFGAFPFGTMLGAAVATPLALRCGNNRLVRRGCRTLCFIIVSVLFQYCCLCHHRFPTRAPHADAGAGADLRVGRSVDAGIICSSPIRSIWRFCCGASLLHPLPQRSCFRMGRVHDDDHRLQLPARQSRRYYGSSRGCYWPRRHDWPDYRQFASHLFNVIDVEPRAGQHVVRAVYGNGCN